MGFLRGASYGALLFAVPLVRLLPAVADMDPDIENEEEMIQEILKDVDNNGDGKLSLDEIIASGAVEDVPQHQEEGSVLGMLKKAFLGADENEDQFLTVDEMPEFLRLTEAMGRDLEGAEL